MKLSELEMAIVFYSQTFCIERPNHYRYHNSCSMPAFRSLEDTSSFIFFQF